jgi:hypothetical protein
LRLSDYVMRTAAAAKVEAAPAKIVQQKQEHTRTIMETPAKQAPTSCSDLVMRIRKLRWVGLEEKAEQLEKELEQCAVTDRVVPLDSPSTLPSAQFTADDECTLDHCPHFLERPERQE